MFIISVWIFHWKMNAEKNAKAYRVYHVPLATITAERAIFLLQIEVNLIKQQYCSSITENNLSQKNPNNAQNKWIESHFTTSIIIIIIDILFIWLMEKNLSIFWPRPSDMLSHFQRIPISLFHQSFETIDLTFLHSFRAFIDLWALLWRTVSWESEIIFTFLDDSHAKWWKCDARSIWSRQISCTINLGYKIVV